MYEFHGWASIREATNEAGEDEEYLEQIVKTLQKKIAELNWPCGIADLRYVNGEYYFFAEGFRNHKDSIVDDLFEMYHTIAEIAPGSYGILYVWDDDLENDFKVFVLSRGGIKEHADPFLSPCIPKIEDRS